MRTAAIVPLALSALALSACSGSDQQPCTPEHHTTCRDGVVYWVDACGSRGAAVEQCPCGCNAAASACQQPCPCIPDCADKQCGPDGCGGRCPPGCAADQTCTAEGRCRSEPSCDGVACQQPGEPNQGPDRDGDGWGDCCDCDDQDAAVNPGANEIIHNRKDDDCDPSTPDSDTPGDPDDRDDDGYLSQQAGGDDCDDLNADIHPGAEERCNGLDDDCDGTVDGPDVCTSPDGGSDGGDEDAADCPNLSGRYDIAANCLQLTDAAGVELIQDACSVAFNLGGLYCTGTVDATQNLTFRCAGLDLPCTGQASPTEPFSVTCSQDCSFVFELLD
jgi:hypothetical protein